MRLAAFQPDIAANLGAMIRCAACFGAEMDVIGPCGFAMKTRDLTRTAMDYRLLASPLIHTGWTAYAQSAQRRSGRLVLLTTTADAELWSFQFACDDTIMVGRESSGAPPEVHMEAEARLKIAIAPDARSLNVAVAAAVALAEARRQLGWS